MAFQTLAALITAVRSSLDEPTTRQWTDAEITRWLNEGARDVTRRTECLKTTQSITTANGTADYALPTNCIRAHKAEITASGFVVPLEYRERDMMDVIWHSNQTLTGTPMFWTVWGFGNAETITLFPVPSAVLTVKVWYYRLSTDAVLTTDPIEVPEGWYDMVVDYCSAMAMRKDADPRWADAMAVYENKLQALGALGRLTDLPDARHWQRVDPYAQQMQPSAVPIQQQPSGPPAGPPSYLLPQRGQR